jgi:hypothetical protein
MGVPIPAMRTDNNQHKTAPPTAAYNVMTGRVNAKMGV